MATWLPFPFGCLQRHHPVTETALATMFGSASHLLTCLIFFVLIFVWGRLSLCVQSSLELTVFLIEPSLCWGYFFHSTSTSMWHCVTSVFVLLCHLFVSYVRWEFCSLLVTCLARLVLDGYLLITKPSAGVAGRAWMRLDRYQSASLPSLGHCSSFCAPVLGEFPSDLTHCAWCV
jgi:hypothetical protein